MSFGEVCCEEQKSIAKIFADNQAEEVSSEEVSANNSSISYSRNPSKKRRQDESDKPLGQSTKIFEEVISKCFQLTEDFLLEMEQEDYNRCEELSWFERTIVAGRSEAVMSDICRDIQEIYQSIQDGQMIHKIRASMNKNLSTDKSPSRKPPRPKLGSLLVSPDTSPAIRGLDAAITPTSAFRIKPSLSKTSILGNSKAGQATPTVTIAEYVREFQMLRAEFTQGKPHLQKRDAMKAQQAYWSLADNTVLASTSMIHKILNRVMVVSL